MGIQVHWLEEEMDLEKSTILVAFPGVGDVGKLAIDAINHSLQAVKVARIMHSSLPPIAKLDEDGLLVPPHLSLSYIELDEKSIFTLTGDAQPSTPDGQYEMAQWLLSNAHGSEIISFAGMAAKAEIKEVFAICSDVNYRIDLEQMGVDVRRTEPKSGVIGMAAMLTSLSPMFEVSGSCLIATTIGTSLDPMASERLLNHLIAWWSMPQSIVLNAKERLMEKLESMKNDDSVDHVGELLAPDDLLYM
ncbi:MAG: PAC2 family protein [Candidatus Poseidoniaceae archaeon]